MLFNTLHKKTYLTILLPLFFSKRFMWSFLKKGGEKGIGHAPKLMEALEKKAADAAPTTTKVVHNNKPVQPKFNPEELMDSNRKWPESSPKPEDASPQAQREPVQASSTSKTSSLGTSNLGSKTTLTPTNTHRSSTLPSATALPATPNKTEAELEANRKLPTGFYDNLEQASHSQPEKPLETSSTPVGTSTSVSSGSSSSQGYGGTGPLLTSNSSTSRTTLNIVNNKPVPHTDVRGYAVRTVNYPDPNNQDPLASKNNGLVKKGPYTFQHDEVHRVRCVRPDCQGKTCMGLCEPFYDRKATGNTTSNPQNTVHGNTIKIANTRYRGNSAKKNQDQYAHMYNKAHDTPVTPEIPQGTHLINQPAASQAIINAEDVT
jgi:hypothetical protein